MKCFFGPYRSENEEIKNIEPRVYKSANFLAAITSTGRYAAAIEKHKIPIAIQPMNPKKIDKLFHKMICATNYGFDIFSSWGRSLKFLPIIRCFFDNDGQ